MPKWFGFWSMWVKLVFVSYKYPKPCNGHGMLFNNLRNIVKSTRNLKIDLKLVLRNLNFTYHFVIFCWDGFSKGDEVSSGFENISQL